MSKVVRSVKNVTKGYSSVQVKVRNGTLSLFTFFLAFCPSGLFCLGNMGIVDDRSH